ncbi:MAG: PAS domain-containing protein [Gemmatimonadales bacterium]|nr:PAS domain-containing protein [Gemmatimonadales bacterium]
MLKTTKKRINRLFFHGRAWQLRVFLVLLAAGSGLFLVVSLINLKADFHQAGSWLGLWKKEWRSGLSLTQVLNSGLFQAFVLILGWSAWFRFRQRAMAHLRLRRSEQKYRSIINHAGEAIFLLDDIGRVMEWNKVAEQLFQIPRRTILNHPFKDFCSELDLKQVLVETGRSNRSLTHELRVEPPGLSPRLLSMTISRISPGAGLMAEKKESFVVVARDITSLKQMESRMGEAEKMAGIGQLAAGIAHQLNTPLGSILLSAQMLEEGVENEDDSEDIRRIIRQTEQCRGIIKGLLNFARPTGSERQRIDLVEVVRETGYLMEKHLNVASVKLSIAPETDPSVFGNRNELEQVFFNLLANALDAMPEGGEIGITIKSADPEEIQVEFQDSGEGVPLKFQDKIFMPFFTTKDYGKGTGLGLSIVARIVHEHGGRIELESEMGRGSLFCLFFPRARDGMGRSALIEDGP